MSYEKMMQDHSHAERELFNALRVLVAAANFALDDKQSTINPTTRFLLADALERIDRITK